MIAMVPLIPEVRTLLRRVYGCYRLPAPAFSDERITRALLEAAGTCGVGQNPERDKCVAATNGSAISGHAGTDAKAGKLAALGASLKGAAAATVQKVADFAVKKYADLETQFGRKGAIAILGASVALSAVPLPGTSLVPIALAKGYMAVKARWSGGESMEEAKGTCGVGQNPGRDKCLDGSFS